MTPEQLKAERAALGLTQQECANLVCVDRMTWYRWEAGLRDMSETAQALWKVRQEQHRAAKKRKRRDDLEMI